MEIFHYSDITLAVAPIAPDVTVSRSERERAVVARMAERLFGPEARIAHHEEGAPYIAGREDMSLSVSHSLGWAAVAFSDCRCVGVDVEQWRDRLTRVAPRVLSPAEMAVYAASPDMLLRAWTLKEALYKAALTPGLDFRADIALPCDAAATTAVVRGERYDIVEIRVADDYTVSLVAR